MKKIDRAYIAGIIDGEGNIGIQRRPPQSINGEISPTFMEYLRITNTDKRLLLWLQKKFGVGTIHKETRIKPNHRKVYVLNLSNQRCLNVLYEVYPYLVLKKEQVDVVRRFRKTFGWGRRCHDGVPKHILKERTACYVEMIRLHREGPWLHGK